MDAYIEFLKALVSRGDCGCERVKLINQSINPNAVRLGGAADTLWCEKLKADNQNKKRKGKKNQSWRCTLLIYYSD